MIATVADGSGSFVTASSPRCAGLREQQCLPLVGPSWQIDFFGRLHALTEAARREYLPSEESGHGCMSASSAGTELINFNNEASSGS